MYTDVILFHKNSIYGKINENQFDYLKYFLISISEQIF
jgi:hypothetical protein